MTLNSERISISIHETENGWYVETTVGTGDTWAEKGWVFHTNEKGEMMSRIQNMVYHPRNYEKQEKENTK